MTMNARHRYAGPDDFWPAARPRPADGMFPGLSLADDALAPPPPWLAVARARIAGLLAAEGESPGLREGAITLARLLALAELDDPPAMLIDAEGDSILARWEGPGGQLLATVRGRLVVLSAWHCMRPVASAFRPGDGRGDAGTAPAPGVVGRLRAGIEWATGRRGEGSARALAEAGRGGLAI
jgi:hypothetical protein